MARKRAQLEADLSLAVLAAILEPGQTLTLEEIAEISGLSRARIQQIERSALKKLRKRLSKAGLRPEDLHFTDHRFAHRSDRTIHE